MATKENTETGVNLEGDRLNTQIVFKQRSEGNMSEDIFTAKVVKDKRFIGCYWPCKKNLSEIKKIVDNGDKNVEWEFKNTCFIGISDRYAYWYGLWDGGLTMGMQMDIPENSKIDPALKKIINIAAKTISNKAKLTPQLKEGLKDFVVSAF